MPVTHVVRAAAAERLWTLAELKQAIVEHIGDPEVMADAASTDGRTELALDRCWAEHWRCGANDTAGALACTQGGECQTLPTLIAVL